VDRLHGISHLVDVDQASSPELGIIEVMLLGLATIAPSVVAVDASGRTPEV
jgi:hypothetical protein